MLMKCTRHAVIMSQCTCPQLLSSRDSRHIIYFFNAASFIAFCSVVSVIEGVEAWTNTYQSLCCSVKRMSVVSSEFGVNTLQRWVFVRLWLLDTVMRSVLLRLIKLLVMDRIVPVSVGLGRLVVLRGVL